VSGRLGGDPAAQDAIQAEVPAARDEGRMGPPLSRGQIAALAVEHMPPGAALSGWLDAALAEAAITSPDAVGW
jgi:hypothetical protein